MRNFANNDLIKNVLIFMNFLRSKVLALMRNISIGKVHASDSHNGRFFGCFVDEMASHACTIATFK